ncbi:MULTISPECIES: hypothetical protein [Bradyrhizobium]|uniref:hypothetical protein n=1 Tax=Bradyrhizobium TaxID=374 RepID=UPI0012E3C33F|nr:MULTISPECIES: hypothetical protein [Bradyrhizobium]MCP1852051.1 putative membrane protein [Bradyrhizobium sp. USDA 4541]MCP1915963.1 putative membrane protein [Bradyrhizobium elkanii]
MSRADLLRQAENAERHADQATDEEIKSALKKAADDYRREAAQETAVATIASEAAERG